MWRWQIFPFSYVQRAPNLPTWNLFHPVVLERSEVLVLPSPPSTFFKSFLSRSPQQIQSLETSFLQGVCSVHTNVLARKPPDGVSVYQDTCWSKWVSPSIQGLPWCCLQCIHSATRERTSKTGWNYVSLPFLGPSSSSCLHFSLKGGVSTSQDPGWDNSYDLISSLSLLVI